MQSNPKGAAERRLEVRHCVGTIALLLVIAGIMLAWWHFDSHHGFVDFFMFFGSQTLLMIFIGGALVFALLATIWRALTTFAGTLNDMKNRLRHRSWRAKVGVAAGFVVFMLASLVVAYLASRPPSPQTICDNQCDRVHKTGRLVYSGPSTPKEFYKEAQSECRCTKE